MSTTTIKPSVSFDATRKKLLADPEVAAGYLQDCLEDGDIDLFKEALKYVAEARVGSMSALAEKTGLNRAGLYRSLSKSGNPQIGTLKKVLDVLGLQMGIAEKVAS